MKTETKTRSWRLYDQGQTQEKIFFLRIIHDAAEALNIPYTYCGTGRPGIGMNDMVKISCAKVFNCFSLRRVIPDIEFMKALGYITHVPSYKSIDNYFNSQEMTACLERLYKILAMPFVGTEQYFGIDSSGFGHYNTSWLNNRNKPRVWDSFNKLHIVIGTLTNVIVQAKVTSPREHDTTHFAQMLKESCRYFNVREITADKGYLSATNCDAAEELGAVPYIRPKRNSAYWKTLTGSPAWNRMMTLWRENEGLFREHYHRRSNVESAFSSMKRKFLPYVRSRNRTAQVNEILAKVCCYNASILVNAIFELGLNVDFKEM